MNANTRRTQRISSPILILLLLVLSVGWLSGCRAAECKQMDRCCAAIQDDEGVGEACDEMTAGLSDPDTCRSVIHAAQAMLETREGPTPEACLLVD